MYHLNMWQIRHERYNTAVAPNRTKLASWSHENGRVGETSWGGCDILESLIAVFILSILKTHCAQSYMIF
jgi:hypothetical protein